MGRSGIFMVANTNHFAGSIPDDSLALCARLAEMAIDLDRTRAWPAEQLRLCGEYGVYRVVSRSAWGGQGWNEEQIVRGYLALSAACLTTTFILTQRTGACRRIAGCENEALKERLLPGLASGELFATVGISHLTTSRRHLAQAGAHGRSDCRRISAERHVALGDRRRGGRRDSCWPPRSWRTAQRPIANC